MTTRKRRPGACPKVRLTAEQVERAAVSIVNGMAAAEAARTLGVDVKTLYRARRRLAAQREATK